MENLSRHINFNSFVEQRSTEIAKFLNDLEMDTKKTGHQALPKSVRRRAMSHNRYRIPLKLRRNIDQELEKAERMQKLPKCRKHIRKRRHLVHAYKLRDTKNKWLSTHIWAAKRMRMISYYGFKIAYTPNNKSFRSAYRYTRHSCTVTDVSYMYALCMTSQNDLSLPSQIKIRSCNFPEQDKLYEGEIHNQGKLICPGIILRCRSSENSVTIRFFFHPAAIEQVMKLKINKEWSVILQQGQNDMYLLNGPQALPILEQALKKYGLIPQDENVSTYFALSQNATKYFVSPSSYALNNKPAVSAPIRQQKLITKGYTQDANRRVRGQMIALLENQSVEKKGDSNQQKQFWNRYSEGQNQDLQKTKFKITLRTRYTHKRKSKMTKQQKKQMIKAERQSSSEQPQKKHKKKLQSDASENSYIQKSIYVESMPKKEAVMELVEPVLVGKCADFYYIWANNSDSCRFWRILSQLNVKIIGRKQLAHYYLQSNKKLYPEDYAETAAFLKHREEEIVNNFSKYKKMPIHKRHNYIKLNSPSPFSSILPASPLSVQVEIVSRGNCQKYSYICELLPEDLGKINSEFQRGRVGIVYSQIGEGERKKYNEWGELQIHLKNVKPQRRIIGSITSGGYIYSKSKEGGVGFINESELSENYLQNYGGYVLVRKVSSAHYMLGQLSVLI